jgi:hypothetical protein
VGGKIDTLRIAFHIHERGLSDIPNFTVGVHVLDGCRKPVKHTLLNKPPRLRRAGVEKAPESYRRLIVLERIAWLPAASTSPKDGDRIVRVSTTLHAVGRAERFGAFHPYSDIIVRLDKELVVAGALLAAIERVLVPGAHALPLVLQAHEAGFAGHGKIVSIVATESWV